MLSIQIFSFIISGYYKIITEMKAIFRNPGGLLLFTSSVKTEADFWPPAGAGAPADRGQG